MENTTMTLKDEAGWYNTVTNNQDTYGAAIVRFAEKWAVLMEVEIASGKTVKECANATSRIADDEGITGFMYGCAVAILSKVWVHGEDLRRWHNKDIQLKDEGDRANEKGTVLNPAVLCIG